MLDNAIKNVSSARSQLGAVQNRLEHRLNNLASYEDQDFNFVILDPWGFVTEESVEPLGDPAAGKADLPAHGPLEGI